MSGKVVCRVCDERKPMDSAEVIKTAGGIGRAWRCGDCSASARRVIRSQTWASSDLAAGDWA